MDVTKQGTEQWGNQALLAAELFCQCSFVTLGGPKGTSVSTDDNDDFSSKPKRILRGLKTCLYARLCSKVCLQAVTASFSAPKENLYVVVSVLSYCSV